jgi:hypothetical protein
MNQNMTRNRLIARYRYFYDYVFQDFGDPATPCSFCCKKTHPICLEHAKSSYCPFGSIFRSSKKQPPTPSEERDNSTPHPGARYGGVSCYGM